MTSCCRLSSTIFRTHHVKSLVNLNINLTQTPRNFWVTRFSTAAILQQRNFTQGIKFPREAGVCELTHQQSARHPSIRQVSSSKSLDADKIQDIEIYYGNLSTQIRSVKIFSLITSATGLAAQPILIQKAAELNSIGIGIAICSFVGFFTFITPFLLHWITKKYVTRLWYNPTTNEYTANTITLLLGNKKTTFSVADVSVPEVAGMFTTFTVHNKVSLFVDPRLFNHPEHYARLMGYDKPLDLKLESSSDKS